MENANNPSLLTAVFALENTKTRCFALLLDSKPNYI